MQNPFKHRPSDDFARRDGDDMRWEARDQRYDEGRSWSEGDGGRTAEAWRDQGREDRGDDRNMSGGHGQQSRGGSGRGMSTPYSGDRGRSGSSYDQYGYGSQPEYGQGSSYGQSSSDWSRDYSRADSGRDHGRSDYGQSDYGRSDYNRSGDYGRSTSWQGGRDQGRGGDYQAQGYAPGSEIWRGQDDDRGRSSQSHHEFEPDYMHWRNQQMSQFDKDYSDWRSERREKFSSDFDNWRRSRPQVKAENPIVGDVADGGTGNAAEAKKS